MKCTIISGSPNDDLDFINDNIDKDSFIIAADSGYLKLNSIIPNLIIGDFDSSTKPSINCDIITLPSIKDDTDTMAAIKVAIERGYDEIEIFGAIGNRFDHTYTNVLSLIYAFDNGVRARIINKSNIIQIIDKEIVTNTDYKYFSVFSLCDTTRVTISGAKYPLNNYLLKSSDNIGQSNEPINSKAKIEIKDGKAIIVFSND